MSSDTTEQTSIEGIELKPGEILIDEAITLLAQKGYYSNIEAIKSLVTRLEAAERTVGEYGSRCNAMAELLEAADTINFEHGKLFGYIGRQSASDKWHWETFNDDGCPHKNGRDCDTALEAFSALKGD